MPNNVDEVRFKMERDFDRFSGPSTSKLFSLFR